MGTTLFAIGLFDCNINRDVFYVWITKILLPELPENSVIFMDNASFHKGKNIEQAIINAGHQIEYLPVYSPDLNPIEHKWSQAKRKKMETGCTIDDLFLIHMLQSKLSRLAISQQFPLRLILWVI